MTNTSTGSSAQNAASTKRKTCFRIVCDMEGDFRVEVLDKPITFWYVVASKMGRGKKGLENAVQFCQKYVSDEQ